MRIKLAKQLQPYMDVAANRVGYLFPSVRIRIDGLYAYIEAEDEDVRSDAITQFRYATYREKILADYGNERLLLYKALLE